jgi:transcriptional regulator with XRE-family HTH domain
MDRPEAPRAPEAEVQRVAEALREAIRRKKISQRQVERVLGQGKGYLSQLLGGTVDLKLKHLFAVLAVIGVEPDAFFLELYDRSDPLGSVRALVARSQVHQDLEDLKIRVARLERAVSVE